MDTVIAKLIPIFILAFIGFLAGKFRAVPEKSSEALCAFLFYFCSPAVSFTNIITSDISTIFNIKFVLSLIIFEFSAFLILALINKVFFRVRGTDLIIQSVCGFYGNISYVGIPVLLTLFNNTIPNIITITVHMLLTLPVIIFLLDWFSGGTVKRGRFDALKSTVKNPNVFVPVIAIILLLLKIPVPKIIRDTAELLGKPTTPVGMFALGLTCSRTDLQTFSFRTIFNSLLSAVSKLIISPLLAWVIGKYLFGLDPVWLNSLVVIAMLPTALNVYILAQRYHSSETFASESVLLSTLLFAVTISSYILLAGL